MKKKKDIQCIYTSTSGEKVVTLINGKVIHLKPKENELFK